MSFPFGCGLTSLRQRMLLAVSSGSLLGLGAFACNATESRPDDGSAGMVSPNGGRGGSQPTPACPNGLSDPTCYTRSEMESKARTGCGQIALTPEPTDQQVADAFLANGCLPKQMACDGCCNPAEDEGEPMGDGSCCYVYCPGACCGRPFTIGGAARLAAVATRSDWLASAPARRASELEDALSQRIAQEWLADALMEHASIASFARFSLELLGLGAPASLLEQAQRAALDEVDHARTCFSLASRFAGRELGPGALRVSDAEPASSLSEAAARAFLEGCVGETIAAAHARAALDQARDREARWALSKIAEDETRHAELAWRFVAWALCQDDVRVGDALRNALAEAAAGDPLLDAEREDEATLTALHAAGRLSARERAALTHASITEVVLPCAYALLSRVQASSADAA